MLQIVIVSIKCHRENVFIQNTKRTKFVQRECNYCLRKLYSELLFTYIWSSEISSNKLLFFIYNFVSKHLIMKNIEILENLFN